MDQAKIVALQNIPPNLSGMGPGFKSNEEDYLFNVFLNTTSPGLSGGFDAPVWSYLLPQHAANQPFARYGLAALGGMTTTITEVMRARMAGKVGDENNCLGYSSTYKIAIALYDKSLQHMRCALSKPNYSIRDALLGCLLVSCFESYHGHNYLFAMHAQNGVDLFYSWYGHQRRIKSHGPVLGPLNASEVDDDLVAAMHRLDVQVLAFFDSRSIETHTSLARRETKIPVSMPSAFLSLSQARSFWDSICSRTFHFLASSLHSGGNSSAALMMQGPTMPYPETLDVPTGVNLFAQCPKPQKGHEIERAKFGAEIKAWNGAYAPIYKQLSTDNTGQILRAAILLVNAKSTHILLVGAFFNSEMDYDLILSEFQSIYTLTASIWRMHTISSKVGVSYNFELGLLPSLFLTATRCRDRTLRRQVTKLLFTCFHRENCWDSFGIGYVALWIMGMEELEQEKPAEPSELSTEELDANLPRYTKNKDGLDISIDIQRELALAHPNVVEPIPEAKRIKITRFNIDLNMRRAQLEYVQGVAKDGEMLPLRQHVVRWRGNEGALMS
jgi:hypothetical protein